MSAQGVYRKHTWRLFLIASSLLILFIQMSGASASTSYNLSICLACSFFSSTLAQETCSARIFMKLTRRALQDLQQWTSGSFCQNGTSSLTSVTSYFSRLLRMEEGNGNEGKEMLVREQKSVIPVSADSGVLSVCPCVKLQVYLSDSGT